MLPRSLQHKSLSYSLPKQPLPYLEAVEVHFNPDAEKKLNDLTAPQADSGNMRIPGS
jgi:hypothetical protein